MPLFVSTKDVGLSPELRNKLTALGISSLEDLLEMLVDEVSKPVTKETVSASSLPAEARTFGLGGGSSQAAKLTDRTFSYTTSSDFFTYDISNIKDNLPSGIVYQGTSVVLTGKGRTASRTSSGSIALPESADQAKVSVTLKTEFGNLVLDKTFPITKDSSGAVLLEVNDQSAAPSALSVAENIELLNGAVANLLSRK